MSGPILQQAREEQRAVHGPAPASPDRGKTFVVEAFDVDVAARSAVCPEQHPGTQCSRLEEASTGKVSFRFEWKGALCGGCPQRAACVGPTQSHRTLTVGEHHDLLQARRQEMQTEPFKKEQRRRNAIEGTQSELVRGYGLRQARYRGRWSLARKGPVWKAARRCLRSGEEGVGEAGMGLLVGRVSRGG